MKKKNQKNSTEKAFEVVNTFKTNAEILQIVGYDIELARRIAKKLDKNRRRHIHTYPSGGGEERKGI